MRQKLDYLQSAFSRALDLGAGAFHDARTSVRLLESLGESLGCDWGTLWKVDGVRHQLSPIATWSAPTRDAPLLERDTLNRSLSVSEGNAGHVWRSRKPIWTTELIKDMCIPRSIDAVAAGLRGGIWFAVKTEGAVYGIVELLGPDVPKPTEELLAGIEILGIRLGEAIEDAAKTPPNSVLS